MRVVQINTACGVGSTGKICVAVSKSLNERQIENYILYSYQTSGYKNGVACSGATYSKLQALRSKAFGNYGFNSIRETKRMIAELERIRPDIVHLHNIHGHDCHVEMLCKYLKEKRVKVYWTFHDCWMFTGYCPYFTMEKCDKWKSNCSHCPLQKKYSWFFDKSQKNHERKKRSVEGMDLTIVTPSTWLADLVKQSFLKDHPVKVIHNGIDLSVFKPTRDGFRDKYEIEEGKHIVLGVAFKWERRKGLDVFVELSKRLPSEYQIVLVGTSDDIDKQLPENIISIHRTQNQKELAGIYTEADVFVNPTREENYPTVNMESLACGTPVVTFRTGGSPEIVDETCGCVVNCGDIDAIEHEIRRVCEEKPYSEEACLVRAKTFDMNERFEEYIRLYSEKARL